MLTEDVSTGVPMLMEDVSTEVPAAGRRRWCRAGRLRLRERLREEAGAATAEYLVATMAAVGFAGLLIVILRGDEVRGILTELVRTALRVG